MKVPFVFVIACASSLVTSGLNAQDTKAAGGTVSRVFHGDSTSCIFNDPEGAARNCLTDTATFLSVPAPVAHRFAGSPQRLRSEEVTFSGAGYNLGGGAYGWTLQQGEYRLVTSYTRGITQNLNLVTRCRRIGDCANYFYMEHDGGVAATGDEAVEALGLQANEAAGAYAGSVTGTTGKGDEHPKLSREGDRWVTDGGTLLDVTRSGLVGELSGQSKVFDHFLAQLALVGRSVPISDAWGSLTHGFETDATLADTGRELTVEVMPELLSGKRGAFVPGVVCLVSPERFEQAVLVRLEGNAAKGHQAVVLRVRYPHPNVTVEGKEITPLLFQGGVCGQYVSADADLKFSGRRTTYPAFGSLTGADLITGKQVGGSISHALPQAGSQAWMVSGPDSRFHLYPGAEIVANPGPGAALAPTLEPNTVEWAVGDRVESPHYMTVAQNVLFVVDQQSSPTDQSYGGSAITAILQGKGMAGFHKGLSIYNGETQSSYRAYGGPLQPPSATYIEGQFHDTEHVVNAPNGALIAVTFCSAPGSFTLFDLPGLKNDHKVRIGYSCDTGTITVPSMAIGKAEVTGSLRRGGSEVCTEDGAHCPGARTARRVVVSVPALERGNCISVEGSLPGLRADAIVLATARAYSGLMTTSTYIAGPGRAGLVACAPASATRAVEVTLETE